MENCSIGKFLNIECHKDCFPNQKHGLIKVQDFSDEDRTLISIRATGSNKTTIENICHFHKYYFLTQYPSFQKKCCNPFKTHKKPIKNSSLRTVNLDLFQNIQLKTSAIKLIPGQKICSRCNEKLQDMLKDTESLSSVSEMSEDEGESSLNHSRVEMNVTLETIDESPIKLHSLPSSSKLIYGKRKLQKINENFRNKMATVLNVQDEELTEVSNTDAGMSFKAKSLDNIMYRLKEQFCDSSTTRAKKLQILTVAPTNWSRKMVGDFFSVGESMVRSARLLEKSSGICSMPQPKKGKMLLLDKEIVKLVEEFYQNNENTRIMPGIKDRVSISKHCYEQKRLLLCTLKELYVIFKQQNPNIKIGFSTFCTLRPKWCVSAGSAGTHSVCVCTIHQNVVLLLHAANFELNFKQLIDLATCDSKNADCMLQRCSMCPGTQKIKTYFHDQFEERDGDILFSQWISTDRTELCKQSLPVSEFCEILTEKFIKLIPHHYTSKAQASYLKERKDFLSNHEAIILLDFSENYSFHIQNEAQGYHWTHQMCTVHPVVCYYKCENSQDLKHVSLCFLSNVMQHDVPMVYLIQSKTIEFLKTEIPTLTSVEYFSDGCAAQYKNCKNFYNLCSHEQDFGIGASWSFFATSHGKSPCDGIGRVVKRSTAMESLRRPLCNQITNITEMLSHCKEKLPSIIFFELLKNELDEIRLKLQNRFSIASTIKGTRAFHYFKPLTLNKLAMKRISSDASYSLVVDIQDPMDASSVTISAASVGSYLAVVYGDKWYIGMVKENDENNNDLLIDFMHPNGPTRSFHWPHQSDSCWVPLQHVLCIIDVPSLISARGQYLISEESKQKINGNWEKFFS